MGPRSSRSSKLDEPLSNGLELQMNLIREGSDLFIMNCDGASKNEGYSAVSYIEVRNDQLPKSVSSGMIFTQDNAALSHSPSGQELGRRKRNPSTWMATIFARSETDFGCVVMVERMGL
jgi:hypothetical protein